MKSPDYNVFSASTCFDDHLYTPAEQLYPQNIAPWANNEPHALGKARVEELADTNFELDDSIRTNAGVEGFGAQLTPS